MANEEKPVEIITLSECEKFSEDMSDFYLQDTFADIVITVGGEKIHAHKLILATRCEYFGSILLKNPNQSEIAVTDTSSKIFHAILKYIYTGSISFEASNGEMIIDILRLAHKYLLNNLVKILSEKMGELVNMSNFTDVLNKANLYNMGDLRDICHAYIDDHILTISKNDCLSSLSQKSMIKFLERDSLQLPEIKVFKIVQNWCTNNKDVDKLVTQCVRLSCFTTEEILCMIRPSGLFDETQLLNIMTDVSKGKVEAQHRIRKIMDENLVTQKQYKSQVISGENTSWLLSDNKDLRKCASHVLNDRNGITVDLGAPYYFNHIKMRLDDSHGKYYRYYIQASFDKKEWCTILDYQKYDCRSYQNLYFENVVARYIRVLGTYSFLGTKFLLVNLEVYFKTKTPTIKNQMVQPKENVATESNGATVIIRDSEFGNPATLLNGVTDHSSFVGHFINSGRIMIQLGQPYMVSSLRILLHNDGCYSYFIKTSVDKTNWETAVDRTEQNCKLWQRVGFSERPVVYILIKGTSYNNQSGSYFFPVRFKCNHFECPATPEISKIVRYKWKVVDALVIFCSVLLYILYRYIFTKG